MASLGIRFASLSFICCNIIAQVNAQESVSFSTPSKNISCVSSGQSSLRCDVSRHAWQGWACTNSGCYGDSFVINVKGKPKAVKSSDTLFGSTSKILAYGNSISFRGIVCSSSTLGLTCINQSGNELHLNREFYTIK